MLQGCFITDGCEIQCLEQPLWPTKYTIENIPFCRFPTSFVKCFIKLCDKAETCFLMLHLSYGKLGTYGRILKVPPANPRT